MDSHQYRGRTVFAIFPHSGLDGERDDRVGRATLSQPVFKHRREILRRIWAHANADTHGNSNAYGYSDADCHCDGDADTYADPNSASSNPNTYSNFNADCDCDTDRYSNFNSDSYTNANASDCFTLRLQPRQQTGLRPL
jgi:hypothetical protein